MTTPRRRHKLSSQLLPLMTLTLVEIIAAQFLIAAPQVQRYIKLTATPSPLPLGTITQAGNFDSAALLSAHLTTNCSYKGVVISTTGFQTASGQLIPPGRILVKMPDTGNYVPMAAPLMVCPANGPTVRDFQLQFRVEALPTDGPGTYSGTFQMTTLCAPDWPNVPGPTIQSSLEIGTYCDYQLQGGKCYVHLGQPFDVAEDVLTIRASGTFTTNAGMYVGLNLTGMGSVGHEPIERDSSGNPTGRIRGAMIGTKDVLGRSIAGEAFDAMVRVSFSGGATYSPPAYFGASPDGAVSQAIWWLAGNGEPGNYNWVWDIRLMPETAQADGNYYFRPEIVIAPRL